MTQPRSSIISLDASPYYHCISRCVRRAFLCGQDKLTGNNFSHRQGWMEERLEELQSVFAIDLCAYAIMSNHYHIVIYIDEASVKQWTDTEVIDRWCTLFKGPHYVQKLRAGEKLTALEHEAVQTTVIEWRKRLMSVSWFMRCLNEHIARKANEEDDCTGRFWEGRFKSQALLDEKALISCMTYVDLNPVRAQIAQTPETSGHTSFQKRAEKAKHTQTPERQDKQPQTLLPFIGNEQVNMPKGIQYHLKDYLQLVDWTGRQLHRDKRGAIDQSLPLILDRLNIKTDNWITLTTQFETQFRYFAGAHEAFNSVLVALGKIRIRGMKAAKTLFDTT